jgi:hypothetical protein
MTRRDNEELRFTEDIERLLQGEEPLERHGDPDYAETVRFARRLLQLQEEPSTEFASRLRRSLTTAMASQDTSREQAGSWFTRLFGNPGLRLAVVSTFVVLAAVGLVWRAGLLFPGMAQAPDATPGMLTAPPSAPSQVAPGAPEMARAEDGAKGQGDESVAMAGVSESPIVVAANITPEIASGERLNISIVFSNNSTEVYRLTPFPPAVAIRETSTGRVVYTFAAGTSSVQLSPIEQLNYTVAWDQTGWDGTQVESGWYEVDVEGITATVEKGDMATAAGVPNVTPFNILSPTTGSTVEDSATTSD